MYSFLNKENCGLLHFKWMDMSCRAHTVVALDHCVLKAMWTVGTAELAPVTSTTDEGVIYIYI